MPSSVDVHFQSSLRGAANNKSPAVKLHRGCSGALHGHGVDKVKSKVVPPPCQRDRSCQQYAYDDHMHVQQQLHSYPHNYQQQSSEESSDAESPTRRKSMLGLGQVLPAAESKGLPPRSPPKFLTYSHARCRHPPVPLRHRRGIRTVRLRASKISTTVRFNGRLLLLTYRPIFSSKR